jgi:nitroreductase
VRTVMSHESTLSRISATAQCDVFEALLSRKAVRAFTAEPVDRATVEAILAMASRAPSGSNIQPWKVWAVAGEAKERLSARILKAFEEDAPGYTEGYAYYPDQWEEPYLSRRRKLGKDLYGAVGIPRGDTAGMKRQTGRNFIFFGAPVGMFVTISKSMNAGSWFDLGTFLQSILLAARGFGLHTCPQQSFSQYHLLIREELGIPGSEIIACGIALGHEDTNAPENAIVTGREPVESFATFIGL